MSVVLQAIDKFLDDSFAGFERLVPGNKGTRHLAIVTAHNGSPVIPTEATTPPVENYSSHFVGRSAEDIGMEILHQSYHCFAVLDERSVWDETVVVGQRIGDEIQTVRADFKSAQLLMQNLAIVNVDIGEAKHHAEADRGVYRLRDPPQAQQGGHAPPKRLGDS
ncbi:hypothetical protein DL766_002875 [Monosporascus sp. MC13-8B]|uniref:Uncharacterized protein n=1 Tax=Monosporascus cannonballus TaxID=155416 RepID=A0ABY0HD44_9PEZI|nr:hypothetical protein DL762_002538 [Monosporascus cannonballus]RYP01359.1 hypothetical protein DL763_000169 [Monosporascus cannonballus]RYP34684.1 hypothetical protein DL766_002875 [Monosporascus sp. MC13-8B]